MPWIDILEGFVDLFSGHFILVEAEEHHKVKIVLLMHLDVVLRVDVELDEAVLDDVDSLLIDVQLGGVWATCEVELGHQFYL